MNKFSSSFITYRISWFKPFTTSKPIETAITVVVKYVVIVNPPTEDNFEISFKSEIPLINDASIRGIAISFKEFMNIVPKVLPSFVIIMLPPLIELKINPTATPYSYYNFPV